MDGIGNVSTAALVAMSGYDQGARALPRLLAVSIALTLWILIGIMGQ